MAYLAGVLAAVVIVGLGYATRQGRALSFYATVLVVIALVYVLFAAMAGDPLALLVEGGIALAFIGVAVVGVRWQSVRGGALLIAAGLIAHGLFDLAHEALLHNAAMPAWWPPFCGVVDLLVGGWLLGLALRRQVIGPDEREQRVQYNR